MRHKLLFSIVAAGLVAAVLLSACASGPAAPGEDSSRAASPSLGNTAAAAVPTEEAVAALADEFSANPEAVRAYAAQGLDFGELFRAYDVAELSGQPVESVLGARAAGSGWDELYAAAELQEPQPWLNDPQPSSVVTATATATATPTRTPTPTATPVLSGTLTPSECPGLKVATTIADYFTVPVAQVCAQHASGLGYGMLFRAYDLAKATGQTVEAILAQHAAGMGWGQLYKDAALQPGGRGLGSAMGQGHKRVTVTPTPQSGSVQQQNSGQGNGNGNGQGNGNGNGNGHGSGGGGNGHGNGNGNGGKP